jgi:uncharacterized cupredoxin-like copper-binding protein
MMLVLALGGLAGPVSAGEGRTAVGIRNGFMSEFSFVLTRTKVKPGPARVQYQNTGEDPHDLNLKRKGSETVRSMGELEPGQVGNLDTKLKRDSRYVIWCSLDGHRESGMEAELRVKKRR